MLTYIKNTLLEIFNKTKNSDSQVLLNYESFDVLVVDTDNKWVNTIKQTLQTSILSNNDLCLNCVQATTLNQALGQLTQKHFNIVLTDLHLHDATGFLIIEQLKKHTGDTPVVIVSNMTNWSSIITAAQVGVSDFMSKRELNPEMLLRSMFGAIERGKLEENLKSSRKLYKNLTEMMPVGMIQTDKNLCITYANDTFCNYFQLSSENVVKQSFRDLLEPSVNWNKILLHLEKTKSYEEFETKGSCDASKEKSFLVIIRYFNTDAHGKTAGYQCIIVDTTVQKLINYDRNIENQLQLLQERIGNIFSEINSSLTSILLDTESVAIEENSELHRNHLKRINQNILSSRSILKPFLCESSDVSVRWEQMDTNKLLETCFKNVGQTIRNGIHYDYTLPSETRYCILEPNFIQRIIKELIRNSIEAIQKNGTISITVSISQNSKEHKSRLIESSLMEECLKITVKDTGSGMKEEVIPRVVEPLYTTKGPKHAGLGLTEVWKLVKAHNGLLEIDSVVDMGTEVKLTLPITDIDHVEFTSSRNKVEKRIHNIILVEDDDSLREATTSLLRHYGHCVNSFANGAEALHYFSKNIEKIDTIITDFDIPVLDGSQLIANVRKICQNVNIVLVTGLEQKDAIVELNTDLVNKVLFKPYSGKDLQKTLTAL